jgi:hypothetical protein
VIGSKESLESDLIGESRQAELLHVTKALLRLDHQCEAHETLQGTQCDSVHRTSVPG